MFAQSFVQFRFRLIVFCFIIIMFLHCTFAGCSGKHMQHLLDDSPCSSNSNHVHHLCLTILYLFAVMSLSFCSLSCVLFFRFRKVTRMLKNIIGMCGKNSSKHIV